MFGIHVALAVAMLSGAAAAQSMPLRDPTEPPSIFTSKPVTVRNPIESFRPEHFVTVNGQRYLMWKGRRHGVGDSIQGARIERLDETGIWLRIDGDVRKLPLYAGIEKSQPSAAAPRASAPPGALKGRTE